MEKASRQSRMIHRTAVVSPDAIIVETAEIGAHVVIEAGVIIEGYVTVFPGAYIGKRPKVAGIVQNQPHAASGTLIGRGSVIGANSVIYAGTDIDESVLIGDGATIRENCIIGAQSIVGNNCTFQNNVRMGKRSRVVDLSHITANVVMEDDVFISTGVLTMNDNSMAHGGELKAPWFYKGAMVGGGAVILPGVHVGADAMVGAGSVVTRGVEAGARVQGVAAKPFPRPTPPPTDMERWAQYYFEYEEDRG